MRVLLTGAAGFLGAHCLREILRLTDWHVVCPVSFRHRGVPERLVEVIGNGQRVDILWCDLSAPVNDTTARLIGEIDVIVNFASQSHVTRSVENPVPFVTNNFNVMLSVLEYARALSKLQAFIQISTDEVYGPAHDGGHVEWDPIIPSTPYSASKAAQEALAISYWRTYGLPLVIVNTMNPLGEMQDPEKFLPALVYKIRNEDVVDIHVNEDNAPGSRAYIHAADLADAILFLIKRRDITHHDVFGRPDRWNVVGAHEIDNLELAFAVAEILGQTLQFRSVKSFIPGHGGRYVLDGSKMRNAGWVPLRPILDVLPNIVQWTVDNPLWGERRPT